MAVNHNPDDLKTWKLLFRAVRSPNYRLFFGGQGISLIGTWIQLVAMSWLVYRLTHSPFLLGFVGFAGQIPAFLISPFAGVLIDRWDRHRVLLLTQLLSMIQALLLGLLDLTGRISVWQIVLLALLLGVVNAFDMPARQAFVVEMVENPGDLGNAIALNSFLFNGARLVGPSIGGILISVLGEGICFLLNALSFVAVLFALLAMKVGTRGRDKSRSPLWIELKEGFSYAFGFAPIRSLLLLLALVSLAGMPYTVLMPVFAKTILQGGPQTYGFLMGVTGVGALIGALYLASRTTVVGLGRVIIVALNIFGAGLIAFSFSRTLALSMGFLFLAGFGMMVQMASCNTIIQTIVEEDKRGRVMSFYAMAFMGMVPFGSLLAGSLASSIGAPWTVAIGGVACMAGSILFARQLPNIRKMVRPIYLDKGILREDQN